MFISLWSLLSLSYLLVIVAAGADYYKVLGGKTRVYFLLP